MDSISESVQRVVAILTAVLSEQEDIASQMVLESDPIELFSALCGILLSAINTVAQENDRTVQDYLQQLGLMAFR
jgi:hypothetical protein